MFLTQNHQKLNVYPVSRAFVFECYQLTKLFPKDERFGLISQIRRAALSVHLNIAEGSSRKSAVERRRYFEMSRGSVVEIDAALDVANDLNYLTEYDMKKLSEAMLSCFKMLSGLIGAQ